MTSLLFLDQSYHNNIHALSQTYTLKTNSWGINVVEDLSKYIIERHPLIRGFSARNIWRMKQFYEVYADDIKLSALLTEFPVDPKGVFKDSYVFEFL